MKKQELELLIQAGDVDQVVISREWRQANPGTIAEPGLWEVYAYGGDATSLRGNVLHAARGERRMFRTLDTAYGFVRDIGFRGAISVEDRFLPEVN